MNMSVHPCVQVSVQDPSPPSHIATFVARHMLATQLPLAIQSIAESLSDIAQTDANIRSIVLPRSLGTYTEIIDLVRKSELVSGTDSNAGLVIGKRLLGRVLLRLLLEKEISLHATAAPTAALVHYTLIQLKGLMEGLITPQVLRDHCCIFLALFSFWLLLWMRTNAFT